jgi:hypothetical protein
LVFWKTVAPLTVAVIALAVAPAVAQLAFLPGSPVAVARQPQYFAVGDFNQDGVDDLAISSPADKTLTILPGGPSGFTVVGTAQTLDKQPGALAVGDLNQDNIPDIAVIASNGVWVVISNGDGTFRTPSLVSLKGTPKGVAIADFDGVNGNDLAITDNRNGLVLICLNDGNGNFSSPDDFVVPSSPGPIVAADFNGDGVPDLGILSLHGSGARNVTVLLGDRNGTTPNFTTVGSFVVGVRADDLIAPDLNDDGDIDMVTANYSYPAYNGQDLTFLLGRGDGFFNSGALQTCPLQITPFLPPCIPQVLVAADLDQNGTTDLAVGVSGGDADTGADVLEIFSGAGDGSFQQVEQLGLAGASPGAVATGDFNGDGLPDIALATLSNNWVQLFTNATLIVSAGSVTAGWGIPTEVKVTLTASGQERVASVQNSVGFDPSAPIVPDSCVANSSINMPDSRFSWLPDGCTLGTCNEMRAVIVNLANPNVTIPNGSALYTCEIDVQSSAIPGKHPLDVSDVVASDPTGQPLNAAASDGAVVVACTGDCNLDDQVTVDEVLTGVNIALGNKSVTTCPALDVNHNGAVTVDELLAAVAVALNGCAPPTPVPSPSATATPTPTPSVTPSTTPVPTATPSSTPTATVPPTDTPTVPPTDTATVPPTDTATVPPTDTPTVPPTETATVPPTDTATVPPTDTPTVPPTDTPTVPPTDTPTVPPTDTPTVPPTDTATVPPTDTATVPPTDTATAPPTDTATVPPTDTATAPPTDTATAPPTDTATAPPTDTPTTAPSPTTT